MQKFNSDTRKELIEYLNRRYSGNNGYVSYIIEEIDDWAYEHDIENDIVVDTQYCEKEEITDGLWEYVGVDAYYEKDYDKKCFIIDITTEGGGVCIYVTHPDEDDPFL